MLAQQRYDLIQQRILLAAQHAGRSIDEITLVGASKKQPLSHINEFIKLGLHHLGENYLQEALEKQHNMSNHSIVWHFIGQIQSNKTASIAKHFNWVHSVDRLIIAKRLANQLPFSKRPLNILLQLNPDNENSKAGVNVKDAPELCDQISAYQGVTLRGFMMIPAPRDDFDQQRKVFAGAYDLLHLINQRYSLQMDTLSMGMSNDLEAAIFEGATMIRLGTDLFGARD